MIRLLAASLLLLTFAPAAVAQKSSGTFTCQAPNPIYIIHVPDGPDHVMSVDQLKCTWIKPMELLGVFDTDGVGTGCDDVKGRTIRTNGYFVDTFKNGDRVYWEVRGGGTLKPDLNVERNELHVSVIGGTGNFSQARGQGTCLGSANADGSSNWNCQIAITATK
jgi:hypothetical protein